jgi:ureidoacrylate peracid hydrolase
MELHERIVTVPATPEPLRVDLARAAVLVIDMQNAFGSPGGMFDRAGIDIVGIRKVIQPIATVLSAARRARVPVIFVKMEHQPDLSDAGPEDSPHRIKHRAVALGEKTTAPDGSESRILIRDTWDTQIVRELTPAEGDTVVSKHRYSGFYQTKLDETLKARDVKYLIVTGCTTSVCVESTVRDAMFRDYSCVVLADCTAEPQGHHDASLRLVEKLFGWVSSAPRFIDALEV